MMHYVFLFVKFDWLTEHNAIGSRELPPMYIAQQKEGGE